MEGLSQAREVLSQVPEDNPDYQQLHGLFETTGHYLGFTYGENRPQGYGPHVVPVDNFAPVNANPVQRVRRQHVQRRGHGDEAGPSNRGERAPSHHDDEAGPSNRGEQAPSCHDDEAGPSSMQFTPGIFNDGPPEPSGQYQYMSPIQQLNPFQPSQDSLQYGGNLYQDCYHPSFESNVRVNRNNSVVRIDINLPWDEDETEPVVQQDEQVQRRSTRNRQPPACGTGGRLGHPH